MRLSKSRRTFG